MPAPGGSSAAAPKAGRPASPELAKLRRGDCTLEEYLDDRVNRALAKLPQWLSSEQRETVRETLRFQMATDPALAEIVAALEHRQPPGPG